jgi:ferric-dicitrate binding protein FerR (iron transport regulator)
MKKEDLHRQLIDRYLEGTASPEEVEVFFHLLNEGELDDLLEDAPVRRIAAWKKYSVAAAVILLVGASVLIWRERAEVSAPVTANIIKNDVPAPKGNNAMLKLADGRVITLDSVDNGDVASQGKIKVVKLDSRELSYQSNGENEGNVNGPAAPEYNTLQTPAGGQYRVILSDGTKVWLNAQSSIRFPTAFSGDTRKVDLQGEAYFEVAKDKARPFVVTTYLSQVKVLGTSFNVNAYADEPGMTTTLLEGSVQLIRKGVAPANGLVMRPGQQAKDSYDGSHDGASNNFTLVPDADVNEALAWKNGLFSFDDAGIHTVMRQIARWYGVKVMYEGQPTTALFGGEIGHDLSLAQVLEGLSKSKVHFRLEGKDLTVLP